MGYNQGFNKQYVQVIIYYYTHRHGFCSKEGPVFFSDEYPTKSSSKGHKSNSKLRFTVRIQPLPSVLDTQTQNSFILKKSWISKAKLLVRSNWLQCQVLIKLLRRRFWYRELEIFLVMLSIHKIQPLNWVSVSTLPAPMKLKGARKQSPDIILAMAKDSWKKRKMNK